ncbi:ribosome small subunit-dependent GTPase A [Lactovum miscens]|uniref:Small ribosomal subunit biogenesis GTPase RsgA n=1 Tax=Lactovum miscens TaxID=190387 RepID=A0A841C4Z2_9LACT|nr:ribosome small subunit-dependent GTPase A [Lactovum miscens]MBB5887414.1 ribosome biogenesis GTPase [Lactovum miscens]
MQTGRIIRLLGGFYTVNSEGKIFETRARGNFRKKNVKPLVGDFVDFENDYILAVHDRRNFLVRPAIANIDQVVVVMSSVEPKFNRNLMDRFLVLLEHRHIHGMIYLTKTDLSKLDLSDYESIGYEVFERPADLLYELKDKVTVFMGQTGVGKSTLLNKIAPELKLATGEISIALGRGKHTTRHVELYEVASGRIADTPGFSSLDYEVDNIPELNRCFIDIYEISAACKFRECTHTHEPSCAVKLAVGNGEIIKSRFESFLQLSSEINKTREVYQKNAKKPQ